MTNTYWGKAAFFQEIRGFLGQHVRVEKDHQNYRE